MACQCLEIYWNKALPSDGVLLGRSPGTVVDLESGESESELRVLGEANEHVLVEVQEDFLQAPGSRTSLWIGSSHHPDVRGEHIAHFQLICAQGSTSVGSSHMVSSVHI